MSKSSECWKAEVKHAADIRKHLHETMDMAADPPSGLWEEPQELYTKLLEKLEECSDITAQLIGKSFRDWDWLDADSPHVLADDMADAILEWDALKHRGKAMTDGELEKIGREFTRLAKVLSGDS